MSKIYNLINVLNIIQNSQMQLKSFVEIKYYNTYILKILKKLQKDCYISKFYKKKDNKCILIIKLKYINQKPLIKNFMFFSKPSKMFYCNYKTLKYLKTNSKVIYLSTSKGILSNKKALDKKLGGIVLFGINTYL